jgi:hypothetical protein
MKTASGLSVIMQDRSLTVWQKWRKTILLRIGNDIVDLRDPQNVGKSQNTRFINRVFTPNEQKLISNASNQDAMLWSLWAGKETAYKVIRKSFPSANSVPRSYRVSLDFAEETDKSGELPAVDSAVTGFVDTPYGKVYIKIFMTSDYVHCIGTASALKEIDSLVWHVDRISPDSEALPDYESMFVRKALKNHLADYINQNPEVIEIHREKGSNGLEPPFVCINGRKAGLDISLSHDGMFTAHAFTIQ